jgi:hypothetical protein
MKDSLGLEAPVQPAPRLRPRSFVKLQLKDKAKQKYFTEQGAHTARDGSLVAIFYGGFTSTAIEVTRQDGTKETHSSEWIPEHFQLIRANGTNLSLPVLEEKLGHWVIQDINFLPHTKDGAPNPNIVSWAPVNDARDLPPGRIVHPQWLEALHNADKKPGEEGHRLTDAQHTEHAAGLTPAQFMAKAAKFVPHPAAEAALTAKD